MPKSWKYILLACLLLTFLGYALILNPGFQASLGFQVNQGLIRLRTWLNPPEQVAFSGAADVTPDPELLPSPALFTAITPQADLVMDSDGAIREEEGFDPPPASHLIERASYFSQHNRWNYCGPANLAMQLSFWGWEGTHDDVARGVRTHTLDKNVMPYELAEYARTEAGLGAIVRVGGDLNTLKRLIAAGYPVVVEKGPHFRDIHNQLTWMGHYQVLNGYNDQGGYFIAQDSYIEPDYNQPYHELIREWRSFNYLYLVIFPLQEENDVLNLLGSNIDEEQNYRNAMLKAQEELNQLTGVDLFFAMYNYGTNLVNLRDYEGAAKAYDFAFALYDTLPADLSIRPYRILWYQTGPFFAYYYTGRYRDVIEKATKNSLEMVRDDVPALEESFYWRGRAKIAVGDQKGGIKDFYSCLEYHSGFEPCITELNQLGIFLD